MEDRVECALGDVARLDESWQRRLVAAAAAARVSARRELGWQRFALAPDCEQRRGENLIVDEELRHVALVLLDLEVLPSPHVEVAPHRVHARVDDVTVPVHHPRRVADVPVGVALLVHHERIAQVGARHRGGELERGDVRRRLRPAPLQLPAAGGREHGRPLLDVIPARGEDPEEATVVHYLERHEQHEQHDDEGEHHAAAAATARWRPRAELRRHERGGEKFGRGPALCISRLLRRHGVLVSM
mmetsp:Transcript_19634/g.49492  ORF Transcript_19634/g.49492 Transcript_19634/m.49492 type:complete len:244 (+) Transcript_19634:448-1179(+)